MPTHPQNKMSGIFQEKHKAHFFWGNQERDGRLRKIENKKQVIFHKNHTQITHRNQNQDNVERDKAKENDSRKKRENKRGRRKEEKKKRSTNNKIYHNEPRGCDTINNNCDLYRKNCNASIVHIVDLVNFGCVHQLV